jgi:hypothetical protein
VLQLKLLVCWLQKGEKYDAHMDAFYDQRKPCCSATIYAVFGVASKALAADSQQMQVRMQLSPLLA